MRRIICRLLPHTYSAIKVPFGKWTEVRKIVPSSRLSTNTAIVHIKVIEYRRPDSPSEEPVLEVM